jgi:hypothetical protein
MDEIDKQFQKDWAKIHVWVWCHRHVFKFIHFQFSF